MRFRGTGTLRSRISDPRSVVKNSTMPAFRYLFSVCKVGAQPAPDALALPKEFAPAADFGNPQGVGQGDRVSDGAALCVRRDHGHVAGFSQGMIKGKDAFGVDAVVVSYEYFHGFRFSAGPKTGTYTALSVPAGARGSVK